MPKNTLMSEKEGWVERSRGRGAGREGGPQLLACWRAQHTSVPWWVGESLGCSSLGCASVCNVCLHAHSSLTPFLPSLPSPSSLSNGLKDL